MPSEAWQNFNFAAPGWLWGLALIPVLWMLYGLFFRGAQGTSDLRRFADAHLLPHLVLEQDRTEERKGIIRPLGFWSFIWLCGIVAMAGPRWDYADVKTFAPARDLVILLDLSPSMQAEDLRPSRVVRGRQEIEDISRMATAMNIGLVAFDSVPHLITPLTDEREPLIHLLPSLSPELAYRPGDNLAPALDMAGDMLSSEKGNNKHILIVSAGSFDDSAGDIYRAERKLTAAGVHIHVMGIGTPQGAPVPSNDNGFVQKDGKTEMFRLEEARLRRIAADGNGIYVTASYMDDDTKAILARLDGTAVGGAQNSTTRFWEERFYLFLIPGALLLLPWFRRNAAFPLAVALWLSLPASAQAFEWQDMFLNKAQQGRQALEDKKYDEAADKFDDPYRRGVAQYRAGKYDEAAKSFAQAARPEVQESARYNLGNAQLLSGKVKDAIDTYEQVLKRDPKNENARYNLEIAKKLLDQQQQKQQNQNQQDKQQQDQQQSKQQNQSQAQNQQQDQKQQDQKQQDQQQNQSQAQNQNQNQNQGEQQKQDQAKNQSQGQGEQQKQDQKQKAGEDQAHGQQEQNRPPENQQQAEGQKENQPQGGEKETEKQAAGDNGRQAEPKPEAGKQATPQAGEGDQAPKPNEPGRTLQARAPRTPKDVNADQWLSRIQNDPESFLKNKFYLETVRREKKEETP